MVTEPTKVFLMLSTAATVALVVAGTGASTLWFPSGAAQARAPAPFRPGLNQAATGLMTSVPATVQQRA
jgi:hypothetical protein